MNDELNKPIFSIIIPTFNRSKVLNRAIRSVQNQTFSDFEILVMDDGSTDNSRETVESFADARIKYAWAENFGGPAAPRNRGLALAEGEYIAFLDSDDWWHSQKLEVSLKYLEQGADLVYHDLFVATKLNQRFFWKKVLAGDLKSPIFDDLLVNGNALPNSSVVVRKQILQTIKGFDEDENLIAAEDYDAWLRISKVSEKFKKIPQTLGYYWSGGGNITNPNRILKNLDALSERYADSFVERDVFNSNQRLYFKGRSYYLLKNYKKSKEFLSLVSLRRAPLNVIYWTCKMLLLINFFYLQKYRPRNSKTFPLDDG